MTFSTEPERTSKIQALEAELMQKHWDSATLDLLEHLVTHPEVRHLFMVGAYRNNAVGPAHPLMRTLDAIHKAGC
jgi:hypothetical protein